MTVKGVFETKEFLNYRDIEFDQADKDYFLNLLSEKGINEVLPFLRVIKKIPQDFLEPIMREVIKYDDISLPKRYMETILRLFTPEKVLDVILKMVTSNEGYGIKCRAAGILYCVGIGIYSSGRDKNGNIIWKCGKGYVWDGKKYESKCIEGDVNKFVVRREQFAQKRTMVLAKEFLQSDNIVFRYYLKRYLPLEVEEYPVEIRKQAEKLVKIIDSKDFPNWVTPLKEKIRGNYELEKLLYDELKWQRKK
ncbi:MAG: hypothetical protein AAGA77_25170 [Bacteroidota bacterium]